MNLEEQIEAALKGVNYPGYSRDIVSFGLVKGVAAANGSAGIDLELTTHNPEVAAQLKAECEAAAKSVEGIERAMVQVKMPPAGQAPAGGGQAKPNKIPGINKIIAVASGKGGVGKSTFCAAAIAKPIRPAFIMLQLLSITITTSFGPETVPAYQSRNRGSNFVGQSQEIAGHCR